MEGGCIICMHGLTRLGWRLQGSRGCRVHTRLAEHKLISQGQSSQIRSCPLLIGSKGAHSGHARGLVADSRLGSWKLLSRIVCARLWLSRSECDSDAAGQANSRTIGLESGKSHTVRTAVQRRSGDSGIFGLQFEEVAANGSRDGNCFRVGDLAEQSEFDESSGRRKCDSTACDVKEKTTLGSIEQNHFHRIYFPYCRRSRAVDMARRNRVALSEGYESVNLRLRVRKVT